MQVKYTLRNTPSALSFVRRAFVSGYGNSDLNAHQSHIPTVNDKL